MKDLNLFLVRYFKKTDPIGKTLTKFMYFLIFVVKFILYPIPYIYVGMQRFIKFLAHQSIFGMKFNGPFKYMTASESGGLFLEELLTPTDISWFWIHSHALFPTPSNLYDRSQNFLYIYFYCICYVVHRKLHINHTMQIRYYSCKQQKMQATAFRTL